MNDTQTSVCEKQPQLEEQDIINVLLVDDDEGDRRLVQQILVKTSQQIKFTVESVDRLSTAIEYLSNDKYDVVLLDLGLPDSEGLETFAALHTKIPQVPIIVLSGTTDETLAIKAVQKGAQDYLIKGQLDGNTLARAICYAIERKKLGERIMHAAQEWRTTFDSISDMVSIHDTNFRLVRVNKAFANAFNTEPKEIIGKTCYEIIHNTNEPCPDCPHMRTIKTHKPSVLEYYEPNLGIHLGVCTSPIFDEKGEFTGSVHIAKNITERKEAEEKLKETMKMKSEFISTVSHELRTPLTAIKEGIALVVDGLAGDINDEQKELLGISKKNVDRLARLINDVLDFQKIESGRMKFNMQPNDINKIVEDVYKVMVSATKNTGVDLLLELNKDLPKARFDNDKIIQVLTNLVNNAIKFTEKGNITIKTGEKNGTIRVLVSDTGCGIKKEDLPRVFNRFEQLATGGERKTGGTGLGLAIAKEIIEKHKGKIWVESEFGKGSEFIFALPSV